MAKVTKNDLAVFTRWAGKEPPNLQTRAVEGADGMLYVKLRSLFAPDEISVDGTEHHWHGQPTVDPHLSIGVTLQEAT